MARTHEARVLTDPEEVSRAAALFGVAMVGFSFPDDPEPARLHEPGRTLGVAVDGELVGTASSYTSWLTVPGGARVPHAAVTHVGVLPTHTRRGLVTALLRRQLADIAARGEIVASLRASEAVIYERFGYGVATRAATYEIARRRSPLRDTVPGGGPVRIVDASAARPLLAEIYGRAAWTGSIDRPSYWWNLTERWTAGSPGPRHVVVHGAPGREDGFAAHRPLDGTEWFTSPNRTVAVEDFVAHTDRAYLGLVRHLAALDPVDTVRIAARPVDDPLSELFVDARAVRVSDVRDETWLRLVDVPAALAARSYRPAPPLVIEVSDGPLPANAGRYRIDGDGARRTGEPAHVSIDVAALASVYLGGTRWSALARAGRVIEHRPDGLALADELFATPAAPFAGTGF